VGRPSAANGLPAPPSAPAVPDLPHSAFTEQPGRPRSVRPM
jgi:hypothetical protein